LARRIDEIEAEINLHATLLLPLCVLLWALHRYWQVGTSSAGGVFGSSHEFAWIAGVLVAVVAHASRTYPLQIAEGERWYHSFLVAATISKSESNAE
jgi:hypothetical protein